jgi:2-hydroxychromene-2-carboxylate isomerase
MSVTKRPRFYFSLRSPYSWLAYRELLDRYPAVADRVEWVPFWEPDDESTRLLTGLGGTFPYSTMSRAKALYILQDVKRLATERGRAFRWPVDRDPVWEIPHLGYLVAARAGLGREYVALAYRTRWEEGRNICDRSVVAEIGGALGLDPNEVAAASDDPDLRVDGARILLDICKDGVFGVPFFVHRFSRYWGLERLDAFVAHLLTDEPAELSMPERVGAAVGVGRSTDEGHAGGCG